MKFHKKIKPSKVLGRRGSVKYQSRAIEGALIEIEPVPTQIPGGTPSQKVVKDHLVLYATNAHSFVRIDLGVKEKLDEPGPIPGAALKHMEKGVTADLGLDQVRVGITRYDRVFAEPSGLGTEAPDKDAFPVWEKVLKKAGALAEPAGSNHLTLDLNPKLLMAVAEAIGEPDRVKITLDLRLAKEYKGKKRRWYSGPIRVQQADDHYSVPEADAYLMPCRPLGHNEEDPTGGGPVTVKRDGRTVDTLDNYRWPYLLGGEADGEKVPRPERSWKLTVITVGDETYFKRNQVFGPVRVVCFVAEFWPRVAFSPYAVLRRLFGSHPELEKMPDIEIEAKPKGDSKRVEK